MDFNGDSILWRGTNRRLIHPPKGHTDEPRMTSAEVVLTEENNVLLIWLTDSINGMSVWRVVEIIPNRGPVTTHETIARAVRLLYENTPKSLSRLSGLEPKT